MTKFKLIGQTTVFVLRRQYLAADFIPSVVGVTEDGKRQTTAREADVLWLL